MLDILFGLYVLDKFGGKPDRLMWSKTVPASSNTTLTISDAVNGAALKKDLASLDYFVHRYELWNSGGICSVELRPDNESGRKISGEIYSQKSDGLIVPPWWTQTDVSVKLTNDQATDCDVFVILDFFKIPQGNSAALFDFAETFCTSLEHIDVQTLGIESYLVQTNLLLKALIVAVGGVVPDLPGLPAPYVAPPREVCRRL